MSQRVRLQAMITDEAGNRIGGTGYEVRFYQAGTNTLASVFPDTTNAAVLNPAYPNAGNQATLMQNTLTTDVLLNIDSSTGFSIGQFITIDDGTVRIERCIVNVNSSTQIQVNTAVGRAYVAGTTQVNGRESLGLVAGYLDNGTNIEMTVKTLATGIEGPRELFLIQPVSDFVKLGDQDLSGLASFTIPATIPSSYSKLILEVIARDNSATNGNDLLNIQLASGGAIDTGANYYYEQEIARGTATVAPTEGLAQTVLQVGIVAGGGIVDTAFFATNTIEFVNYKETTSYKTARAKIAAPTGTATGNISFYDMAGYWKNTGQITSIKIAPSAGTAFATGSRLRWYGAN